MVFGTAEEDAFRRDATVNALFFHLEKQEVVDLTGKGLEDLDAKIMRTPLDPKQTFMDDPLRVLRLIRIGSKLGFSIDPLAASCMRDRQIHQALDTMITRDRVGAELVKMMRSRTPEAAFHHIYDFYLYAPIFIRLDSPILETLAQQFPFLKIASAGPWPSTWPRAYQLLAHVIESRGSLSRLICAEGNADSLWTMAAYCPLAGLRQTLLKEVVKQATASVKLTAKITQLFENCLRNFDSIRHIVDEVALPTEKRSSRSSCAMAIRSWGSNWTSQVAFVMLSDAVYDGTEGATDNSHDFIASADQRVHKKVLATYETFADFIIDEDLRDAHSKRPLLNGKDIQELFGLKQGGKYLKEVMDKLMAWQFANAEATKEDAQAWLVQRRDALKIPKN